ncbi:MAG: sulfite exporter TauE/SafE family protein [Arcobacteraceae bacterium]
MSYELILIITATLFVAGILHGSIGFGFPLIATPIIALFTDMQTAIFFTLIPTVLVNIISIKSEGSFFNVVKEFFPFAIVSTIGSLLGTFLLIYFNSEWIKVLLALIIFFYLLMDKFKVKTNIVQQHPKKSLGFFGLGAGVMGGLANAMSPLLIVYSFESNYTKSQTIQFSNLCFLLGKIIQLIIFSFYAVFTPSQMGVSLSTLLVVAIAFFFGVKIRRRIDANSYKIFIKWFLFIMAVMLLVQVFGF